jgi:hypothetical protein
MPILLAGQQAQFTVKLIEPERLATEVLFKLPVILLTLKVRFAAAGPVQLRVVGLQLGQPQLIILLEQVKLIVGQQLWHCWREQQY